MRGWSLSRAVAFEGSRAMTRVKLTPERLRELYVTDVWRYVSAQLDRREDAEDATMETFAAAFRDFRKVRKADDPRLWLFGVARNKVADVHRRRGRRNETQLSVEIEAEAHDPHTRETVRAAMAELQDDWREALLLKYVAGLSVDDVAKTMDRTPEAVNSLLQRARAALRERLTEIEPETENQR